MKKAAELLLSEDNLTVAEVSYKVGISDPFISVNASKLIRSSTVRLSAWCENDNDSPQDS